MTKVLALNRGCIPVEFKDPRDAFRLLCKGNAYIFDVDFNRFSLDEWIMTSMKTLGEFDANMNTVKYEIPVPPVIVLHYYEKVQRITMNPSRENIWKRDGAACAYCRKTLKLSEATLDHVHPKSKGGPNTWTNLATACMECNQKKDDELLHDIHDMELSVDLFVPNKTSILYTLEPHEIETMPEFWKRFFVEFK